MRILWLICLYGENNYLLKFDQEIRGTPGHSAWKTLSCRVRPRILEEVGLALAKDFHGCAFWHEALIINYIMCESRFLYSLSRCVEMLWAEICRCN